MKISHHLRIARRFARAISLLMIVGMIAFGALTPARAQNNLKIEITKPDISNYPEASIDFRIFTESGVFVKNIDPPSVHVIENEQIIALDSLEMLEPGIDLIIAINEAPRLANGYATVLHMDKIKGALSEWIGSQSAVTPNQFSFITNTGALITQSTQPENWLDTVVNYTPDLAKSKSSLTSLTSAIDLAASTANSSQQTSVIFYITPMPTDDQTAGLEDLISRAKLANIRLYIWLIGSQKEASDIHAEPLSRAAQETQGQYLFFSGPQELPSLTTYFDPLINVYRGLYQSKIKTSGDFPLYLSIKQGESNFESESLTFTLNVLPPNPIFLSPPSIVERTWTETKRVKDSVLTPDSISLRILIEFPDGLERDLVYSRFFIDDMLVDENTSAPFEDFEWDISGYTESGTHRLSASIEDSAGFIVQTLDLPVEVVVQPKPQTWIEKILSSFSLPTIILFFIILMVGILLVLMAVRTLRKTREEKNIKTHRLTDPLTQPVLIENEFIQPKTTTQTVEQWPHIPGSGLAHARLLLQSKAGNLPFEIPIGELDITFGSDPKGAKVVLTSTSISPLHARIARDNQEYFKLYDEGSGSGTWLNYAPVSQYGARLEHGDLVQFGTVAYRFEIHGSQPPKLLVERLKEEE